MSTDQVFDAKQRWIELRIGNSGTRVVLFTPEGHESRIGSFFNGSFACDDVGATYRQLKARGVEFDKPPEKQPWGEFAIFKDPDGNQVRAVFLGVSAAGPKRPAAPRQAQFAADLIPAFCSWIQLFVRASSRSSGSTPPFSISSWKLRMSNFGAQLLLRAVAQLAKLELAELV